MNKDDRNLGTLFVTWPKIDNIINITTTTNINREYDRKSAWIFGHIYPLMFVVVMMFISFSIFAHIHLLRFIVVVIFIIFSVMFTNFGHTHSVSLIRSAWFGHVNNPRIDTLQLDKRNVAFYVLHLATCLRFILKGSLSDNI